MLQSMIPKINNTRLLNRYVKNIRLIHGNEDIFDVYDIIYYSDGIQNGAWKKKLAEYHADTSSSLGGAYVSGIEPENDYFRATDPQQREKVLNIYSPIYSRSLNNLIGVVELSVKADVLVQPCTDVLLQNGEVIQYIDYKGNIVYSSDPGFTPPAMEGYVESNVGRQVKWGNTEYQAYYKHIDGIDSWVALYMPQSASGSENYKYVIFAISAISLIASVAICLAIYKLFATNIQTLTNAINKVKTGDLSAKAIVKSGDEIQYLADHFNEMTAKVNALMDSIKAANEMEREAIYKSLENQMKPHFLCNALDFIRMSAELQNNTVISEHIRLIMNYFNYNINRRQHFVTLREELANVNDFICIYNIIYKNKIEYSIDISPEMTEKLDGYYIIKYILQPIAENAVKHAFPNKNADCFVTVEISKSDNEDGTPESISISIEDNGEGMEQDVCRGLLDVIRSGGENGVMEKTHSGVGLPNIYRRMKMIYKDRCDLSIESYPNVGTRVTVTIPARGDRME